jgi:AraC-like DNA-binding protein
MNSRKSKLAFQQAFLKRAGQNFVHVKRMMDALPNVGFYIKDINDRIVTLNARNCEISALRDEFDAIGKKSSDLFPEPIAKECLARDALVRKTDRAVVGGVNRATVDRSPHPTIYSVFPLHDAKGNLIGTMCGFYYTDKAERPQLARANLQPAIDWMIKHNGEPSSLATLAKQTNLSVTHFRRLFCETFKETPAKYALRLRLNRAREALETTDATIADIALNAGFYDQSHFIKAFRNIYKIAPTEYRHRHSPRLVDI